MKKQAKDLKKGNKIKVAGKVAVIETIEFSEVAGKGAIKDKKAKRKCRIEAKTSEGERLVIIRPDDYPFDVEV
jgi:translation elongation factor P/translation initiation factor 5A